MHAEKPNSEASLLAQLRQFHALLHLINLKENFIGSEVFRTF